MVYIFDLLPLSLWCPTIEDLEKIRAWLLHKPVTSEENQTARILLSNLNYQLTEVRSSFSLRSFVRSFVFFVRSFIFFSLVCSSVSLFLYLFVRSFLRYFVHLFLR